MKKISLSRYLYFTDEVIICAVDSIINKRCIDRSIFWISEYYYSGYKHETFELLFKIYYDFYSCIYPYFESFMQKRYNYWKDDMDIKYIISILVNLIMKNFYLKFSVIDA